jgi:DNA-binding NtrC family response regulator
MRRIGSVKDRRVNVRIIAATNRDLATEVEAKRFREDLYYRINVMMISLPSLHERGDDVYLLADHFAGPGWEWEPKAREVLKNYHWPGNVRQLANAIERAKILADNELIQFDNLPPEVIRHAPGKSSSAKLDPGVDLAALNRAHVVQAMQRELGNKMRAARALGVSRRSLYRLLEKFNVGRDEYEE